MIELKNVRKVYKAKKTEDTVALNNITTKIPSKGMIFIVGTSGSGKSTLLNCIGGLDNVDDGSIIINNVDITKLNEHDLDKFRNSYLGFVFQDYNVIEDYNVFENINLSLELQGINDSTLVSKTLDDLGLHGLEKRHINELSGGQKQRVAIARALVKNPSLILADEPTGNLDSKSSKQIFEILKHISENRTVLVVSHDMEMARTYGDSIIEISDGEIIKDTNKTLKEEKKDTIELKQYHLSKKNILKLTLGNIRAKLGKFVFTIILLSFAFFFLEFTYNMHIFKTSTLAYDTMKKNNDYYLNIGKENCSLNGHDIECEDLVLTDDDIKNLENVTKHKLNKVYSLLDGDKQVDFHSVEEQDVNEYYTSYNSDFVSIDDEEILSDIVGRAPKSKDEIVIYQRKAEYIVKYGVLDKDGNIYKPNSVEDLINDNKELKFGSTTIKITGYIKLNDHTLVDFKDKKIINDESYKSYFNSYIIGTDEYYYVTPEFIDTVNLSVDYDAITNGLSFVTHEYGEESSLYSYDMKILTEPQMIITKEGIKEINNLKEDEIIVPVSAIEKYYEGFKSELANYYKTHPNLTYEESVKEYTLDFVNKKRFIDKKYFTDRIDRLPSREVKIIGISLNDTTFVSQELIDKFIDYNKIIEYARLYENDRYKIKHIFDNLELDSENSYQTKVGEFNVISSKYVGSINAINYIYKSAKGIIAIVTAIFVLFAVLLFHNFIATTITYSKKKIGILRAIGTSHKDVGKIFNYESLIIGIVSTLLSVLIWIPATNLANNLFNYTKLLKINYIAVEPLTGVVTLTSVIIGAIFLTSVSLSRLKKIKPIDEILDK